jgi:hypothetical protein
MGKVTLRLRRALQGTSFGSTGSELDGIIP